MRTTSRGGILKKNRVGALQIMNHNPVIGFFKYHPWQISRRKKMNVSIGALCRKRTDETIAEIYIIISMIFWIPKNNSGTYSAHFETVHFSTYTRVSVPSLIVSHNFSPNKPRNFYVSLVLSNRKLDSIHVVYKRSSYRCTWNFRYFYNVYGFLRYDKILPPKKLST